MNKGTDSLNNVLKIFETMTVEEYEKLYDEVCKQYEDTQVVCILDMPTKIKRIYDADEKIIYDTYISNKNIHGYKPITSKSANMHRDLSSSIASVFQNAFEYFSLSYDRVSELYRCQQKMVSYVN